MTSEISRLSIAACFTMLALAGEPLFKPTGKYAVQPAKTEPAKPEPSNLHSHLCQRCNHEWWHDPTKGPVSHNCPKCGREQWTIHRKSPPGARLTNPTAATPQQVDRAPASRKTVYVVGATWCAACVQFHRKHGDGDEKLKYVYADIDRPRPATIDVVTWNEIVRHNNSGRFVYPFFVVLLDGVLAPLQARVE